MKRTPLSIGSTIQAKGGSSYTYIIDRVIGDGASSIVYEAHYIDSAYGRHDVRLKECYPYASDIQRIGTELVWTDSETAMNDKVSFTTAYHKLLDFQNTTKLRNSTAHIFDLCEANGTLYSVMDVNEGQTFEQDNSGKLSDILKTTLALARVVEKYHNNGYLHLDIKPSNFLIIPETRELVILFDVDSVTSMEDISSGKVKCVSYSKGWAAPEQMQGRIDKLCPATDIYSIGAILFQKVMDRAVENEDIGIFADWDFDGKMFEEVNPKIKRMLRNIFRKTLAANIKKRYQSVDSLISALEAAVECVRDGAPYLISDCPNPNKNFLGREKELADIAAAFNNGKKTIFLHGFGGIGKSELAKKYAELHGKEYDTVLFMSYEDSLEDMLDGIQIQNCDAGAKNDNIKTLKKIFADQRVLLIVDNFDVKIDSDDYLDTFLRLKVDKIFTTRTDFTDIADDKTQQISIENLKSKELVSLFEKESTLSFSDEDRAMIEEILKIFNYYTLIVPILAKQLISSGWSLETLKEKAKQGLRAFEDTEKVSVAKDGRIYRKTGLDMMRATFRMVCLTDIQRRVLTNLYLLRFIEINKEEYRKYLWRENDKRTNHIDAINDLLYLGWIKKKYGWDNTSDAKIEIHPVIVEMIEIELKPNVTTSDIAFYIQHYMPWNNLQEHLFEGVDDWGQLYQDSIANKLDWFCFFANNLDLCNSDNLTYVVTSLFKLINGNLFVVELIKYWQLNKLLEKIALHISACDADIVFMFEDICLVFEARNMIPFFGPKNAEEMRKEAQNKTYNAFFKAHAQIQKVSLDLKNTAILTLCKPILQLVEQYSRRISRDIYKVVEDYENVWYVELGDSIWHYSELEDGDFLEDLDSDFFDIHTKRNDKDERKLNKETDGEFYYIHKYEWGDDVEEIVKELINDARFTNTEKVYIFDDMINTVMRTVEKFRAYNDADACWKHKEYLKAVNWNRLRDIATHGLTFCKYKTFEDGYNPYIDIATAERVIAIAEFMLGNPTKLEQKIFYLTNHTVQDIYNIDVSYAKDWKAWTQFWDISSMGSPMELYGFGYYANICRNLLNSHLILTSLIQCMNALEEKIDDNEEEIESLIFVRFYPNDLEDSLSHDVNDKGEPISLMYNWYRIVAEFALNSAAEVFYSTSSRSEDSFKGIEYFDIFTQYCEKARALLTTTAEIQDVANNDSLDIQFFHYQYSFESISDICKEYYFRKFLRGVDITEFIAVLRNDDRLSEADVFSLCQKICDEVFFEIDRCWTVKGGLPAVKEYLDTYNWHNVEALLDFQEDLFVEQENDDIDADAVFVCDKYRAVTYSILGDKENFDYYMGELLKDCKDEFDKNKERMHWSFYAQFLYGHPPTAVPAHFIQTLNLLMDIEKSEQALPYMVAYAEYVHEWLKTLPNYSEVMMYDWYKMISDFAEDTSGCDVSYYKYQDKVDEMADKHYELSDSAFDQ